MNEGRCYARGEELGVDDWWAWCETGDRVAQHAWDLQPMVSDTNVCRSGPWIGCVLRHDRRKGKRWIYLFIMCRRLLNRESYVRVRVEVSRKTSTVVIGVMRSVILGQLMVPDVVCMYILTKQICMHRPIMTSSSNNVLNINYLTFFNISGNSD